MRAGSGSGSRDAPLGRARGASGGSAAQARGEHRSPPTRASAKCSASRNASPGLGPRRWRRERAPPAASAGHAAMAREVTVRARRSDARAYVTSRHARSHGYYHPARVGSRAQAGRSPAAAPGPAPRRAPTRRPQCFSDEKTFCAIHAYGISPCPRERRQCRSRRLARTHTRVPLTRRPAAHAVCIIQNLCQPSV